MHCVGVVWGWGTDSAFAGANGGTLCCEGWSCFRAFMVLLVGVANSSVSFLLLPK